VPETQRKIGAGEAKGFEDDRISIKVLSVERTAVDVSVNDGEVMVLEGSKLTLVPIDDATMCTIVYLGKSGAKAILAARCDPMTEELRAAAGQQTADAGIEVVTPVDMIAEAARGELKNPYTDDPRAVAEGRQLFLANSCNGCHGGTGGGGMGPPLSNEIWVYGSDDDTLFRLIALGSDGLKAQGYNRKGSEAVVGPMPPHGGIVKSNGDMWKIISWIRKINPSSGG
jgi:mono/diheme cytochrome c family protein